MENWKHPIALELKHDEKIIGGRFTKRHLKFLIPAVVIAWYSLKIPFKYLYILFLPKSTAEVLNWITCGVLALIVVLIGLIISFVPARMVTFLSFFNDPKPKINLDPYDIDETIDSYVVKKWRNKGKQKVLPYRVVKD